MAFLGTCLVAGVFGICLGALSSYPSILVFVAFTGFGVGGNVPIDTTSKRVTRSCIFSFPSNYTSIKVTVEYLPEVSLFLFYIIFF